MKAQANLRNHGVSFESAQAVFNDPFATVRIDDRYDYGEERFVIVGTVCGATLVLSVAYTERAERVRIISARKATLYEQDIYFQETSYVE